MFNILTYTLIISIIISNKICINSLSLLYALLITLHSHTKYIYNTSWSFKLFSFSFLSFSFSLPTTLKLKVYDHVSFAFFLFFFSLCNLSQMHNNFMFCYYTVAYISCLIYLLPATFILVTIKMIWPKCTFAFISFAQDLIWFHIFFIALLAYIFWLGAELVLYLSCFKFFLI